MITERCLTKHVDMLVQMNPEFAAFVDDCFNRFENYDWGDVSDDDAEVNGESPIDALGTYPYSDDMCSAELWIKSDGYVDKRVLTALFPDEY